MLFVILQLVVLFPVILYLSSFDRAYERKNKIIRLYGIYGYFGLPGAGKTIAMCQELNNLRKRYGSDIYITTNFYYDKQDFPFEGWRQLLVPYDKPLIVAWDEVQNEFNSRDFKNFPIALLTQLTQVRKGNGIRIYYTSQRFHFVDKNFRSLSFGINDCSTVMGRYTIVKTYDLVDYEEIQNQPAVDRKRKIRPKKIISFVQTKKERDCYDSFKMLETAKSKEYMTREEVNSVSSL